MSTLKMYHWQAVDKKGNKLTGKQIAADENELAMLLRQQEIFLLKSRRKLFCYEKKITGRDITLFTRQLMQLLQAGIALLQALQWMSATTNKLSMKNLLNKIQMSIEQGCRLHKTLAQFPRQFNAFYCHLIAVGEQTGQLDNVLQHLTHYREKQQYLKKQISKALFYPALVLLIAFAVTAVMMLVVIPQFQSLFANFNAILPWPTQLVISCAQFFKAVGIWIILFFLLSGIIIVTSKKKFPQLDYYVDYFLLKIPGVRALLKKSLVAMISRYLAMTLTAGLPILEALRIIAGVINNQIYQRAIWQLRDHLQQGDTLHNALRKINLFPVLLLQMVAVGEQSGDLDNMLEKTATILESELDHAVATLATLIEPILMLILGIIIGSLLIALYLPIFRLGSAL